MDPVEPLPWRLYTEVRNESLELQRLRARILGFKITAVGAGIGVVLANSDRITWSLLVVAALAACFFDFLTLSYSRRIILADYYARDVLEPQLRAEETWAAEAPLWLEYQSDARPARNYGTIGTAGLTVMASGSALVGLAVDAETPLAARVIGGAVLLVLLGLLYRAAFPVARTSRALSSGTIGPPARTGPRSTPGPR